MQGRMLGKKPAVYRPGTLMLAAYLPEKHMPIPEKVDNYSAVSDFGMMMNDQIGDCAIAAPGHMVQAWTKLACNKEVVISDAEIVKAYSDITGYIPGDPSTDLGSVEADVLDHWKNVGIGGHKIDAYSRVEVASEYQVRLAVYLFGAAYTGVGLPETAQDQKVWSSVHGAGDEPGSWGGHGIPLLGYSAHRATCITWGAPLDMTWSFWRRYADEAYACLSLDWVDEASKMAPNHLDWQRLSDDLSRRFHIVRDEGDHL
jgi:hypothetical protein